MTYTTIQPPFSLKFKEMSNKELTDYFAWFQCILPQRLDQLELVVKTTQGFDAWRADCTVESLDLLGCWFAGQVEMRPRTKDEIQEIAGRLAFPIDVPDEELTNKTFSLAMDVGMYLSKVFFKSYTDIRWDQPFGNKKFVDYGQPVLMGFGSIPFNPVRMSVTLAYGVASQRESGKSLRELYDIWAKMILPRPCPKLA